MVVVVLEISNNKIRTVDEVSPMELTRKKKKFGLEYGVGLPWSEG